MGRGGGGHSSGGHGHGGGGHSGGGRSSNSRTDGSNGHGTKSGASRSSQSSASTSRNSFSGSKGTRGSSDSRVSRGSTCSNMRSSSASTRSRSKGQRRKSFKSCRKNMNQASTRSTSSTTSRSECAKNSRRNSQKCRETTMYRVHLTIPLPTDQTTTHRSTNSTRSSSAYSSYSGSLRSKRIPARSGVNENSIKTCRSISESRKRNRLSQTARSQSLPPNPEQAQDTSSNSTAQGRGRNFVRNRDLFSHQRRPSSLDGTRPIKVTETPNIREQSIAFERLRSTSTERTFWNKQFPKDTLVVYTDGSAYPHVSGYGVYMGPRHPLNRSHRIVSGPHDADRAELLGAIQALQNIKEWDQYNGEKVILRTDKLGIVYAMRNQTGGPPWYMRMLHGYQNEIKELKELSESFPKGVTFQWVKAHAQDPGNEAADDLARQATVGPERSKSHDWGNRSKLTPSPRRHSCHVSFRQSL